jgi:hypothetical protein
MDKLLENEHPLVTPSFLGTDAEKIVVLNYWSDLIRLVRSLNSIVISHDNKLAIVNQLQNELNIINSEINNVTAHVQQHADGSEEMSTMPQGVPDPDTKPVVNLAEPETTDRFAKFNPPTVPTSEAMQRLAGTYYANKLQRKAKTKFKK